MCLSGVPGGVAAELRRVVGYQDAVVIGVLEDADDAAHVNFAFVDEDFFVVTDRNLLFGGVSRRGEGSELTRPHVCV
jgi:hypothetical protein